MARATRSTPGRQRGALVLALLVEGDKRRAKDLRVLGPRGLELLVAELLAVDELDRRSSERLPNRPSELRNPRDDRAANGQAPPPNCAHPAGGAVEVPSLTGAELLG